MLTAHDVFRVPTALTLTVAVLAASCQRPFLADDPLLSPDADARFRTIEAMALEDRSRTPPVTPDAAQATTPEESATAENEKPSLSIRIEDVRSDALANNLLLEVQIIDPAIAGAVLDEEEAKFEAAFFARVEAQRREVNGPLAPPLDATTSRLEPGIRIPLRGGGEARVSLPVEFRDVDPLGAPSIDATDSGVRFSFSQPLLRDAGVGVNTASIQVARFNDRREEARSKLTAIRVLANAEKAYWELYAATREVEILHDRYESTLEQLAQARRLVVGGVVAEIEIVRAQAGVARRLESVIFAETRRRLAETDLKRIVNRPDLPLESVTVLVPQTEPRPRGLDLDPRAIAALAITNRMELLELEIQLAIDAVNVEVARNAELPVFALDFDYSFKGTGDSFSDSTSKLADNDLADWVVGATIDIPLGNHAARARFRQAVLRRTRTLATRALRELAIRQEVSDALDQLEQDWQRVLAARRETILVGRNFEAERRQFQAGVRTSTEVLEAADFLAEARTREVRALADYQVSMVNLAFATGTVLGQSRIHWPAFAAAAREDPAQD